MFGVELLRAGRLYPRQVVDVSDVHTDFAAEWVYEKQCFFRRLKFSPSPPPISHIRVTICTNIATPMAQPMASTPRSFYKQATRPVPNSRESAPRAIFASLVGGVSFAGARGRTTPLRRNKSPHNPKSEGWGSRCGTGRDCNPIIEGRPGQN